MICDKYEPIKNDGSPCFHFIKGGFCRLSLYFRCYDDRRRNSKRDLDLTYSSIKDFNRCPYLFFLHNIKGIKKKEKSIRMLMGIIVSDVMQIYYMGKYVKDWTVFFDKYNLVKGEDEDTDLEITKLIPLMEHYRGIGSFEDIEAYPEYKWTYQWDENKELYKIHGRIDLLLRVSKQVIEFKYTTKPQNFNLFTLTPQLGIYFLGLPEIQSTTARLLKVPQLKLSKSETLQDYAQRLKLDIKRRPNFYIQDYVYYRSEIDLDQIKTTVKGITRQVRLMLNLSYFYQNRESCLVPFKCDYYPICSTGVVSDNIYTIMKGKEKRNGNI